MPEKFDFSKTEDQKEFENLSQKEKDKIVGEAQEEAEAENLEKEPSEKEAGSELKKGLKMKKIEIPEMGEVKYSEKKVMFPEKNVRETGGVKGYLRKIIPWEEIKGQESILKILETISNGEFPSKTYTHVFRGTYNVRGTERIFSQEGMLLQKIFHPKTAINISKWEGKNLESEEEKKSLYAAFGTNLEQILIEEKEGSYRILGEEEVPWKYADWPVGAARFRMKDKKNGVNLLEFLDKNKDVFLYSIPVSGAVYNYGLSLLSGDFEGINNEYWMNKDSEKGILGKIIFGFNHKNKVFKNYLELLIKLSDELFKKYGKDCSQSIYDGFLGNYALGKILLEEPGKYIEKKDEEMDTGGRDTFHERTSYFKRGNSAYENGIKGYHFKKEFPHPFIPIILNNKNIPELRWCHAQWASIPTKKGWNIIEMITDDEENLKDEKST